MTGIGEGLPDISVGQERQVPIEPADGNNAAIRAGMALCGRLSVGKGFLRSSASLGRCGRVFDLLVRHTSPLAIMPSAKAGPDRKHALEALGQLWVFPSSGFDRMSHYFMFALPNFDKCGSRLT